MASVHAHFNLRFVYLTWTVYRLSATAPTGPTLILSRCGLGFRPGIPPVRQCSWRETVATVNLSALETRANAVSSGKFHPSSRPKNLPETGCAAGCPCPPLSALRTRVPQKRKKRQCSIGAPEKRNRNQPRLSRILRKAINAANPPPIKAQVEGSGTACSRMPSS